MRRFGIVLALLLAGCGTSGGADQAATNAAARPGGAAAAADAGRAASASEPWFADVTEASGLRMTHFNGMSGEFLYPEVMAPGVALFDYDNDGDLDVFVPQATMLGKKTLADAFVKPEQPLRGRLFRNDLA